MSDSDLQPNSSSEQNPEKPNTSEQDKVGTHLRRRPLLRSVGALSTLGMALPLSSRVARADHETTPCGVRIDFNRSHVARVFDVRAAEINSLTVFYFEDGGSTGTGKGKGKGKGKKKGRQTDRIARKQEDIDPTVNADYGDAPLRVRYDRKTDTTVVQIGGPKAALRRVVAYGPDCRSAKTNPLDAAAGDNEPPEADFTWTPDPVPAGESATFSSTASDPDGELVHYGWDFDADGTENRTGQTASYTFGAAGEQRVTHTVIDDFDATDAVTKTIDVCGQVDKLTANGGTQADDFGGSVAMDGDTVLVGDESTTGTAGGSAYVFTRSGGRWSKQTTLTANDGDNLDRFGVSVALDGTTAVVGANFDEDPNGDLAGSAYVFTRSGGNWSQQAKLTPNDGDKRDRFGSSVSVDDDAGTAIVGAYFDEDPNGEDSGSAYVFTRSGGSWSQQQKLTANDGDRYDRFGRSVAVSDDTLLVGAPDDDDPNGANPMVRSGEGSVYVFTHSSGNWTRQTKLTADDGDLADSFGEGVALDGDGDSAIVGAETDDSPERNTGSAYVFTRSGGNWSQQQKLTADDGDESDLFGGSVAMDDDADTVVVGANRDEDPEVGGSAYVFTRSGGNWSQGEKLAADDAFFDNGFGQAVDVDGTEETAVVGAPDPETPDSGPGAAYLYRLCTET